MTQGTKPNSQSVLIAEIGINHNGDMDLTKQLIDISKKHGWDYVKFQKRDINTVYTQDYLAGERQSPWGTTQRQQKEGLEFGQDQYDEIDRYCKEIGIGWFASAWDEASLDFLEKYNPKYHKVASAMVTKTDFLKKVASLGRHSLISTGMATYDDIDQAVDIFREANCPFTLFHTVSTYPCPENKTNIGVMLKLKERYNCDVGYSGHEAGTTPTILAASYGASFIERHITLDRAMYGSDQAASLAGRGMEIIAKFVRNAEAAFGSGEKVFEPEEQAVAKKLRYFETQA